MDKKIEDYLHLYIGQKCKYIGVRTSFTDHIKGPLIHTLVGMFVKGRMFMMSDQGVTLDYDISDHKLLLRSLSDMTDEEGKEWLETFHNSTTVTIGEKSESGIWYGFLGSSKEMFRYYEDFKHGWPDGFIYLLSKGFDLFGLIESGLAIDKTKI